MLSLKLVPTYRTVALPVRQRLNNRSLYLHRRARFWGIRLRLLIAKVGYAAM